MEFSSSELFVEILVAGALFALGFSPLIALLAEDVIVHARDGTPPSEQSHEPKEWKHLRGLMIATVAIAVIYAVGVAGNRVVEILYNQLHIAYSKAPNKTASNQRDTYQSIIKGYGEFEREARNAGDRYRDWVERHKTYRKVLRAASASSVMFAVSTLLYAGARRKSYLGRNVIPFCSIAIVLALFFTFAYLAEDEHFKQNLAEIHSDLQKKPGVSPAARE